MEQYLDASAKRYVQEQLFKKLYGVKTMIGLAGTHPEEYVKVLPSHRDCILVDLNPVNPKVRRNSLVGEFDLQDHIILSKAYEVNFVDCDFCKTVLNCGDDLVYIHNKLKKSRRRAYLSFTFSIRPVGVEYTLKWLSDKVSSFTNRDIIFASCTDKDFGHRKFVKKALSEDIYMYRDSGDIMLSGLITINKYF